mgnify:CR=1 FL=1
MRERPVPERPPTYCVFGIYYLVISDLSDLDNFGYFPANFYYNLFELRHPGVLMRRLCCCGRRRASSSVTKWSKLLRHLLRLRRLQRIFAYSGQYLQEAYPDGVRRRLRWAFPNERRELLG